MRIHRVRVRFLAITTTLLVFFACASAAQADLLSDIGKQHHALVEKKLGISKALVTGMNERFKEALNIYLNERTPTNPTQRDAFLNNVSNMLISLSKKQLQELGEHVEKPKNKPASENSAQFNQYLDAVAYYTVAADDVIVRLSDNTPPSWSRRPDNTPRKAKIPVDWSAVRKGFDAHRLHTDIAFGSLTSPQNLATADASDWITVLRERMVRLYSNDPAVDFAKNLKFVADVARVYYLMVGRNSNGNTGLKLRGINLLAPLANQLNDTIPKDAVAADAELDTTLSMTEQAFGFRQGDLMPTGILSAQEFFQIISAGYLPNDVGAEVAHGSLTHRLQWNMIMEDFRQAPDQSWHYTPLDLFTRIGQFDLRRDEINRIQRFAFERLPAIWAQLFDEQGERVDDDAVFTRPDSMLNILKNSPSLTRIFERVNLMRKERINEGIELLKAVQDQHTDWTKRDWTPKSLSDVRKRIDDNVALVTVADELYQERYFYRARTGGTYKVVPNPNGSASNLLIRKDFTYSPDSDTRIIKALRSHYQAKLAPSATTASTSDDRVRFRDRDQAASTTTSSAGNNWEHALRHGRIGSLNPQEEKAFSEARKGTKEENRAASTSASASATEGRQTTESQESTRRNESAAHSDIHSTHFPAVSTDSLEQDSRRPESITTVSGRTRGSPLAGSGSRERVPQVDAP